MDKITTLMKLQDNGWFKVKDPKDGAWIYFQVGAIAELEDELGAGMEVLDYAGEKFTEKCYQSIRIDGKHYVKLSFNLAALAEPISENQFHEAVAEIIVNQAKQLAKDGYAQSELFAFRLNFKSKKERTSVLHYLAKNIKMNGAVI